MISYRTDLINTIKPFFLQLNDTNNNEKYTIQEEKHIPFLKSLSRFQIEVLHKCEILDDKIYNAIVSVSKNSPKSAKNEKEEIVREIIKNDKMEEIQKLIRENGISAISPITKSFIDVENMGIPIINECIIQKATNCFKYLLINGIEDPTITIQDQNPYPADNFMHNFWKSEHKYEWDCMAIAIYYGEVEIMKILEEKGIEKGNNPSHIEAAILSYRNGIVNEIINQLKEKNEKINNDLLLIGLIASTNNNNIKGFEMVLNNGADLNAFEII